MSVLTPTELSELLTLSASFARGLRYANRSPQTILLYQRSILYLDRHLAAKGMPRTAAGIKREHVEDFIGDVLLRRKPATAASYHRSLQQFFKWLLDEGEITVSPMVRMRMPFIPETPPPVLEQSSLRALLKACDGRDFRDRRDRAIILLLADTGVRRSEIGGIRLADVDMDLQVVHVLGKGRRMRAAPFGITVARALDQYLRMRARQPDAHLEWLWLGRGGRCTYRGIAAAVKARTIAAGLDERINLHRFRHTFAHEWLDSGGNEGDLMRLAGWKSTQMIGRYGASAASTRARTAHKKLSLADRL